MADIPFHVAFVAGGEQTYVAQALASGRLAGNGAFTARCQQLLRDRYHAPAALLTHSCTAALEMAAMLLDCGPGDEVIVPSYTFTSTAAAFLRTGASVVFADVDPDTMMLDPADVAARITARTRAVCVVHYAGAPAPIEALGALCSNHGIALVEDAAQGLHARVGDRWLGTFGRLAAFSFHETKNIHCGLGGALLVNDATLVERAEHVWERGTNRAQFLRGQVDKYTWVELGSSFYPSELQAAFLLAQLEALDRNRQLRSAIWSAYHRRLVPLAEQGRFHLQRVPGDAVINGHAFTLRLPDETACEALRLDLASQGIAAHTHYVPLHTSPLGLRLGNRPGTLPHTERWAPTILRLPLHHALTAADIDRVCTAVEHHPT